MRSGLRSGWYALLAESLEGARVEVHGYQGGNALAPAGQHGHFVEVTGSVDRLSERVSHIGVIVSASACRTSAMRSSCSIFGAVMSGVYPTSMEYFMYISAIMYS
jgi:hypothetical protein